MCIRDSGNRQISLDVTRAAFRLNNVPLGLENRKAFVIILEFVNQILKFSAKQMQIVQSHDETTSSETHVRKLF